VVLLYGLSFAALVVASAIFLTGSFYRFAEKPLYITPDTKPPSTKTETDSLLYELAKSYQYSEIVSFLMKWTATVLLLYHYSQRMGKAKYWVVISLPLAYFAGTYLDDFQIYEPHTKTEELYWDLYTSLNSTAGGILFFIAFIVAVRPFHRNLAIKDYMIMSGFGFLLFFSAGQSTLTNTLYPPFGLATMSLYGLSTYMILLGLYSSAVSVSQDNRLRGSIKRIASANSNLLSSIGTAQMEKEIQNTVNSMKGIVQEQEIELEKQSGIEANMEEDEMKNYLEQVMQEVGKAKKPPT
jgi:glycopeptide antibiotics resistance protein